MQSSEEQNGKWLIYGAHGWIGSQFCAYLQAHTAVQIVVPEHRADDIAGVKADLEQHQPDRVLSFIGRTSGPGFNTIDYLEQPGKLRENLRDNLFSPLILMKLCEQAGIHFTYLGTGCIFSYEQETDPAFEEEDKPNFFGSSYSTVKGITDQLSVLFSQTLNVRIRMPIVGQDCPKNFISKIIRYQKIYSSLNSMTVLEDAIPVLVQEVLAGRTGTINLVNPGPVNHETILSLYKQLVDPNHSYELVTEAEHDTLLLSKRSKNVLVPTFALPGTLESVEKILRGWVPAEQ